MIDSMEFQLSVFIVVLMRWSICQSKYITIEDSVWILYGYEPHVGIERSGGSIFPSK